MTYEALWKRLTPLFEAGEAKAIVRWLLDVRFGLSMTDILCGKVEELSEPDMVELGAMMARLAEGEPVQYVAGKADFCGRQFRVAPGVLIPRPETAELCRWISDCIRGQAFDSAAPLVEKRCGILDIGTGSGCIAVTLALEIPGSSVTAWDISDDALRIASENAGQLGTSVAFEKKDVLNISPTALRLTPSAKYDLIVSNPPYICHNEARAMERNVLEHEPRQALFVPDDDPLLFYRAIARLAIEILKPEGSLFFELNPLYAADTERMVRNMGLRDTELRHDQFGKQRFLKAMKI